MSIASIDHVRGKSQSKGSARALLLNLAIYANDCCGVAWPSDATLYHDVNVSRQRIHELKNALEKTGELVIVERPGFTNLYFVAWQGVPLGGTPPAPFSLSPDKPERRNPFWCEAHGFCHGERLPDHRPDCRLELPDDPRGAGPEGTP